MASIRKPITSLNSEETVLDSNQNTLLNAIELSNLINKYIPSSVLDLLSHYVGTEGILYLIIMWAIFILYCIFVFYVIRILVRRK